MSAIEVDQSYNGPKIMQGFMKKRKDTRSFGTLIGTFNTRYFTLDLGNMAFTYRKNEQSTKVKYFPLDDIKAVRRSFYKYTGGNAMWKFPFTIRTSKRVYLLIARDEIFYNNLMNAFRHMFVIGFTVRQCLYDDALDDVDDDENPSKIDPKRKSLQPQQPQQNLPTTIKSTQNGTEMEEPKKEEQKKEETKKDEPKKEPRKVETNPISERTRKQEPEQVKHIEEVQDLPQPTRIDLAKNEAIKPTQSGTNVQQGQKELIYEDKRQVEHKEIKQEQRPQKQQIIEVDIEQLDDVKGGNTVHDYKPRNEANMRVEESNFSGNTGSFKRPSVVKLQNSSKDMPIISPRVNNTQGRHLFEASGNSKRQPENNPPITDQRRQINPTNEEEDTLLRRKKRQVEEGEEDDDLDFLKSKVKESEKKEQRAQVNDDLHARHYQQQNFRNLENDSKLFKQTEDKPARDDDWDAEEPAPKKEWDNGPVKNNQGWQPTQKNDDWDDAPVKRNTGWQPTQKTDGWDDDQTSGKGGWGDKTHQDSYKPKTSEPVTKKAGYNGWGDAEDSTSNKKPGLALSAWDEMDSSRKNQPASHNTNTQFHEKSKIEVNKKEMYEDWDDDM